MGQAKVDGKLVQAMKIYQIIINLVWGIHSKFTRKLWQEKDTKITQVSFPRSSYLILLLKRKLHSGFNSRSLSNYAFSSCPSVSRREKCWKSAAMQTQHNDPAVCDDRTRRRRQTTRAFQDFNGDKKKLSSWFFDVGSLFSQTTRRTAITLSSLSKSPRQSPASNFVRHFWT